MSRNLLRAGTRLVAWNRGPAQVRALAEEGAIVAPEVRDVSAQAHTIMATLATPRVVDRVLGRGTGTFAQVVRGRTPMQLGVASPAYSHDLDAEILAAGGRYVEPPVIGSRKSAETGALTAVLGDDTADVDLVSPLLQPIYQRTVSCGRVPQAMATKLANNLLIGTMLASLAEASNYARAMGMGVAKLMSPFNFGPMASGLLRMKEPKLIARDFAAQAALANMLDVSGLIASSARDAGIATQMLDIRLALFEEAAALGSIEEDVRAVIRTFERRTSAGDERP